MSAPFQPGDVVVCVDGSPAQYATTPAGKALVARYCKVGAVYRVEGCRFSTNPRAPRLLCLTFVGVNSEPLAGFIATRFRKIDDEVTASFREQLRKLPVRERVS